MIPTIMIYCCPEAPDHLRFLGRFQASNGGHQPIFFTGPDAETLRAKMRQWWEDENAKIARPRAKPPGRKAAPPQPLPVIDPDGWL